MANVERAPAADTTRIRVSLTRIHEAMQKNR